MSVELLEFSHVVKFYFDEILTQTFNELATAADALQLQRMWFS